MTRRTSGLLILLALAAAACGDGGPDPLVIGMKRIALNLAFADEELANPVEPTRIIRIIPAPQVLLEEDADFEPYVSSRPRPPQPPPCPVAGPNVFADEPVPIYARGAPAEGVYRLHSTGTITITGTVVPLTIPYPTKSTFEIRNVKTVPGTPGGEALTPAGRAALGLSTVVTFDRVTKVSPELTVADSWRYDEAKLELIKRVVTSQGETTFDPQPAVTFFEFGQGEGDTWSSAGIDTEHNLSMVVQGQIPNREFVDVCGKIVDALRVVSNETSVNLDDGSQSGTDATQPNVYWFANQFGALLIKEEGHFTQVLQVDGTPVTVEFDYTSTLDSVTPSPAPNGRLVRSLLRAALVAVIIGAAACGSGDAVEVPLAKVPVSLVPAAIPSGNIKLFPNTDRETVKALASAGDRSLVADAKLWELRQGERLVGALQVATVVPKLDLTRRDNRQSVVRQIMPSTVSELTVADIDVAVTSSNDKVVYLWFSKGMFQVLQLKGSKLLPEEVLTQILAYQTASDAWKPLPKDPEPT